MEKVVSERDDMAFYLKMFPLVSLHPEAYGKSKSIVCAKTNEERLKRLEAVYDKKSIPEADCETDAIDRNIKLANSFGINGTPAIIFQNGQKVSGALQQAELVKMMEQNGSR